MRVSRIAVAVETRYGDNDYGSQRAEVELTAELELGDDPAVCQAVLIEQARTRVLQQLRNSPNVVIRRKANERPKVCSECGDPIGDFETTYGSMHPACEEALRERRRQEREAAAARPSDDDLEGVLDRGPADNDGDEDDEDREQGDATPQPATAAVGRGTEDSPF